MVGDYINIMKTTFDFNFSLCQAVIQHGYTQTWKQREPVNKTWKQREPVKKTWKQREPVNKTWKQREPVN